MDSDYRNHTEAVTDAERAGPGEAAQISRVDYDAELRMHNEILRRRYGIRPRDHVLDIGCGARKDDA